MLGKNCYKFKVKYGIFWAKEMRTINAVTYNEALNLLYFPPLDDNDQPQPQPDAAELIGLLHNGMWKGDNVLSNPSTCDLA